MSLSSSYGILSNLNYDRYDVTTVGITKEGTWYLFEGDREKIRSGEWCTDVESLARVFVDPSPEKHSLVIASPDGTITERVIDVAFPVLHGSFGEDGTMQGLLAIAGIPYVGCDHTTSGICMDKAFTKRIVSETGIRQAKAIIATLADDTDELITKVEKEIGFPAFIKPARAGSSVGITKAMCRGCMTRGLKSAFAEDSKILIEEQIVGHETEVAVFGNGAKTVASVPGEIEPGSDFYDYETKYISDSAKYYIPSRISAAATEAVRAAALKIYSELGCRGLARVDFFVTDNDEVIFNEINTMPGFTPISMYPKLMREAGMSYSELIDGLIALALE